MRKPVRALLRDVVAAYRTLYGFVSIVGIAAGITLAAVLGDIGWFAVGLVPAVLFAPLKTVRLRRVLEQRRRRGLQYVRAVQIPHAVSRLEAKIDTTVVAKVDAEISALVASQTKQAKQLADSFERIRADVVSATAATRRSIRVEAEINGQRVEHRLSGFAESLADAERAIDEQINLVRAQTESYRVALEEVSERLGDDRHFDKLAAQVARMEPEVARAKRLGTETERLVGEVAELTEASQSLQTRLGATRLSLRSEFALFASQLGPTLDSADQLILILSPQRSGTTLAFDALRSLPGCGALPTNDVYRMIGAAGNRYPWDLLQDRGEGVPITIRDGVGGILPVFASNQGPVSTFVEKVHPSSTNFDAASFLRGVETLSETLDVKLVLLVRDPADAAASFLAYQERGSWHSEVEAAEVPAMYSESFRMIAEVKKALPDSIVLDYTDIRTDSVAAFARVIDKTIGSTADRIDSLQRVLTRLDQRTTGGNDQFFGQHKAPSGIARGRLDIALSPLMADAQTVYVTLQESNLD